MSFDCYLPVLRSLNESLLRDVYIYSIYLYIRLYVRLSLIRLPRSTFINHLDLFS